MKCEFDEFLLWYCKDVASLISTREVPQRGPLVRIRMTNVDWVKYSNFVRTTFIRNCVPAILQRALYQWCPIVSVAIRTSEGYYFFPRKNDQFTRGISGLKSFWPTNTTFRGFNCTVTYTLATYRAVNCTMRSGADLRPLTQLNETRQDLRTSGWFRQGRKPERQVPLWVTHAKRLRLANRLTDTKSQWLFDLVLLEPKERRPTTNTDTRSGYLQRLPHVRTSSKTCVIRCFCAEVSSRATG